MTARVAFAFALCLAAAGLAAGPPAAQAQEPAAERAEQLPDWRGIWFVEGAAPGIDGYYPRGQEKDPYVLRISEMPLNDAGRARLQVMGSMQAAGKSVSWGFPMMMSGGAPLQFLVTPAETVILTAERDIRHIYTDGRPLPAEEDRWPTVWGESVGHWEGDTLVIETVSVEEPIKYFFASPPLSSQARYTERIRMVGPDLIENQMTVEDPEALSAPWTSTIVYRRAEGLDRLVHNAVTNDRTAPETDLLTILPPADAAETATASGAPDHVTPLDPVQAIVEAFDRHQVVALGEGNHGNIPGHQFRLQLIRDPAFRRQARDIVVEFGNSAYQDVADRFLAGEPVPDSELRKIWRDTAQANPVWDVPIYEEFFRAVRDVNVTLPAEERLRVVLGDVPFDWSQVRTLEDYMRQPQRSDTATAEIITREVLSKGRKALVIFGDLHLLRHPLVLTGLDADRSATQEPSIVAQLERDGVSVFSVFTNTAADLAPVLPATAEWSAPKMVLLEGTPLGRAPFTTYYLSSLAVGGVPRMVDGERTPRMDRQFDALLYLGHPRQIQYSMPAPELCRDQEFLDMRFFRMELVGFGAQVEQARQYCRAVAACPAPAAGAD